MEFGKLFRRAVSSVSDRGRRFRRILFALAMISGALLTDASLCADTLELIRGENGEKIVTVEGEIMIEFRDGNLLFQNRAGELLVVRAEEIKSKKICDEPTKPMTPKEVGEKLLKELPPGFKIYKTKRYVVAYQTEIPYARWVAKLYDNRLRKKYKSFWDSKDFDLTDPRFPFVAIVFRDKLEYDRYVTRELGTDAGSMVAYYNKLTNRVAMYDLTADVAAGPPRPLEEVLQDRRAIPMVTTIIHEGTHQLMFNTGMQVRMADSPVWMNEGLAMYFETPDLNVAKGWLRPGLINRDRLIHFLGNLPTRKENSLETLISTDDRFNDPATSLDAYAEAWSLTYFLLEKKSDEYVAYLQAIAEPKWGEVKPEERLADFKKFFGDDLKALDAEFLQYVKRL